MSRPISRLGVVAFAITMFTFSGTTSLAQEGEKKVSISQVPAKVKAAILKEVGDGKLVDIGESTKGENKLYEIEMVLGGKEFDVLFSSDGKVLKTTFEGPKAEVRKGGKETGKTTDRFQDSFDLKNRKRLRCAMRG